jgi:hypothetical protein
LDPVISSGDPLNDWAKRILSIKKAGSVHLGAQDGRHRWNFWDLLKARISKI